MAFIATDQNADGTLAINLYARMHEIVNFASTDTWDAYPALTPLMCEMLDTVMSPAAYTALHFHKDTFERILSIDQLQFEQLPIFKCFDNGKSKQLHSHPTRAQYIAVFNYARDTVASNRIALNSQTREIGLIQNMAFAVSSGFEGTGAEGRLTVKGFHPYFSESFENPSEYVFVFFHTELDQIVMATSAAPDHAVQFMLRTGTMQLFDKLCAWCGKIGQLAKCKCKIVRYCCRDCQVRHWASHSKECRAERLRRAAAAPAACGE